jgi:predicted amidophosphoribosyltransferase
MYKFYIEQNPYLLKRTQAFYNMDYVGYKQPGNPDYINTLKNTYGKESQLNIENAMRELAQTITPDLQQILAISNNPLTLCVVPRAKSENNYARNQKMFRETVQNVGQNLGYHDGAMYIIRHTDTKTTHLSRTRKGDMGGVGDTPYPGITEATCALSPSIQNKNILLVDDIYTKSVNIDEDAIQALYNNGAQSVLFYAVARTAYRG